MYASGRARNRSVIIARAVLTFAFFFISLGPPQIASDDMPPRKIRGVVSEIHQKSSPKYLRQMQFRADKLSAKLKRSVEPEEDEGDNVEDFHRALFRGRQMPLKR